MVRPVVMSLLLRFPECVEKRVHAYAVQGEALEVRCARPQARCPSTRLATFCYIAKITFAFLGSGGQYVLTRWFFLPWTKYFVSEST